MLQEDNKKKHDARIKRKMIVNVHKQNVDYQFFQMSRHRKTDRPRTPDPGEEWKKRQWGTSDGTLEERTAAMEG